LFGGFDEVALSVEIVAQRAVLLAHVLFLRL
jgi:hypothetical protein